MTMQKGELESLADTVEKVVENLKTAKAANKQLLTEKQELRQKVSSLEREAGRTLKEEDQISELTAQNKAYKKKCALLKSRIASMLAKVESLQ
jgi:FtsZ-binding cell division protein ZapB